MKIPDDILKPHHFFSFPSRMFTTLMSSTKSIRQFPVFVFSPDTFSPCRRIDYPNRVERGFEGSSIARVGPQQSTLATLLAPRYIETTRREGPMQAINLYRDVMNKISALQIAVNNLVASNNQSGTFLGANLINSTDMASLAAVMVTLQADRETLRNTIPPIVAGN